MPQPYRRFNVRTGQYEADDAAPTDAPLALRAPVGWTIQQALDALVEARVRDCIAAGDWDAAWLRIHRVYNAALRATLEAALQDAKALHTQRPAPAPVPPPDPLPDTPRRTTVDLDPHTM